MLNRKHIDKQVTIIGSNIWLDAEPTIFRGILTGTGLLMHKPVPLYQMWAGSLTRFIRNRD